jgi:hypothetical protein
MGCWYWERHRKVLIKLFQKFAVSKGRALVARARAKLLKRRFSFANFSLCAFRAKEKSGK